MKYLSSLHVYPVKGLKGTRVDEIGTTLKGAGMDRRWMVVDASTWRFLSQRLHPKMALVEVQWVNNTLTLTPPKASPIALSEFETGERRDAIIWKDTVPAIDQGDEIANAMSEFLQFPCRLVFMPDTAFRQVSRQYSKNPLDDVSFADGFPFLLTTEASLEDLNQRLAKPVEMDCFRPNLVISGCTPYEEDKWKIIKIGSSVFENVKPCARCRVVTVDQKTGKADPGGEPLKTLAAYRKFELGLIFGVNLIQRAGDHLRVGDSVEILENF